MSDDTAARGERDAAVPARAGGVPVFARLAGSSALLATGADAVDFLHGQLANDVKGLGDGGTVRSLLLNHKGHAMAEAQVLRFDQRTLALIVDDGQGDWVRETLERHIVFDEVELRSVDCQVMTVQGDAAAVAVGALGGPPPAAGQWLGVGTEGQVYGAARSAAGGFDLTFLGPDSAARAEEAAAVLAGAGAVAAAETALDAARVAGLVPAAGREGGEGVLPQEAGLEGLVSFRKGCYLGQEIMARIEARGSVRRGLVALELSSEPPSREVTLDGRVVGRLGTVARLPDGAVGALAVLRKDVQDSTRLSVGPNATARVVKAARMMPT